ncbi:hypothetical protein MUP46_01165 [Patescibacteria group bacterium]|nr:hypothetical protein [Patescibacteria group bacterium]
MRSAQKRIQKYAAGLDPTEIYLKLKKQKRAGIKAIGIQTLKDIAVQPIIIKYDLDARKNALALEAWRKLYYIYYQTRQKAILVE